MKKSIAFILPYFGKFNNYFPLFIRSCVKNPTVDWFIFTDNNVDINYPNIHIINMSFEEIKDYFQSNYDFKIKLDTPYEFCDYKVAYGEIFAEYIKDYDYWGFCDCDLIFGDIRKFVTDDLLEKYDKIYFRGHCTIFKNTEEICKLYRNPINGKERYKYCFTHTGVHHFDEGQPDRIEGINMIFYQAGKKMYDNHDFMDVMVGKYRFLQADFAEQKEELDMADKSFFMWDNGNLYRYYLENGDVKKKSYMYIHLQKRSMSVKLENMNSAEKFVIVPNEFIKYDENRVQRYFKMNKDKIYWSYLCKRIKNKLYRILHKGK